MSKNIDMHIEYDLFNVRTELLKDAAVIQV